MPAQSVKVQRVRYEAVVRKQESPALHARAGVLLSTVGSLRSAMALAGLGSRYLASTMAEPASLTSLEASHLLTGGADVRVIAIEEHFGPRPCAVQHPSGFDRSMGAEYPMAEQLAKLDDVGLGRLADTDAAGIDLQVRSQTVGPLVGPADAGSLAPAANAERLLGL